MARTPKKTVKKKSAKKAVRKTVKKKAPAKKKAVQKSAKKKVVKKAKKKAARKVTKKKAPAQKKTTPRAKASQVRVSTRKVAKKKKSAQPKTSRLKKPKKAARKTTWIEKSKGAEPINLHHRRLTARELKELRGKLVEMRRQFLGDMSIMEKEALDETREVAGNHLADSSGDQYEQDFTLQLLENETLELRNIQRALDKIDGRLDQPYGICEATGDRISIERLRAKPHARLSIDAIRKFEQEGGGEEFGILPETKF